MEPSVEVQSEDATSQCEDGGTSASQDAAGMPDKNGSAEPKAKKKNVFEIDRTKILTTPGSRSQVGELQVSWTKLLESK